MPKPRRPSCASTVGILALALVAGCTTTEGSLFDSVQSMICNTYSGCCTQHGWNNGWAHGMCFADGSAPEWITAAGAQFQPDRANACLTRVQAWVNTNVDCATQGSEEYSAGGIVAGLCPDLYVGGDYQTTPLGNACTGISPCVPSPYGPTTCATGVDVSTAGMSTFTECVVWVTAGVLGDVCGTVDCSVGRRSYNCLPARPSAPRWAQSCGPGLFCDTTSHCATMVTAALGASCLSLPCTDGAWCERSGTGDAETAVCIANATVGQPCGLGYEQPPFCDDQTACSNAGICTAPAVTVATGSACDGTTTLCPQGDYCDPGNSLCRILGAGGAPCSTNTTCASGDCLNGQCTRVYPPGISDCQ